MSQGRKVSNAISGIGAGWVCGQKRLAKRKGAIRAPEVTVSGLGSEAVLGRL